MLRVQGLLEVTVVGCNRLKDTEWITRQDPYVCLEYGGSKCRTRTCKDGHKNPTFQEKFVFTLIEGLREIVILVWNSNTITNDDFIGSGRAQLHKVILEGFDDRTWTLQTKSGKHAGEVRIIMHYSVAKKPDKVSAHSAPHYAASHPPAPYSSPSRPLTTAYSGTSAYPSYPPNHGYPPSYSYPSTSAYPPPSPTYPPPPSPPPAYPQSSPYYPPPQGPYPGAYPPRPY